MFGLRFARSPDPTRRPFSRSFSGLTHRPNPFELLLGDPREGERIELGNGDYAGLRSFGSQPLAC